MAKPVTFSRLLFWLPCLWLAVVPAYGLELVLNGSAAYQQLTRTYYLAGLWLPQTSNDPAYIQSPSTAKRMQLVVDINRWTPRKWASQWQNNIAINNDLASARPELQQALMTFTQFPRDELQKGDEILVEFSPGANTRVLLNGDPVIESPGTDLFNFLLNTWIGKLPPSREFRHQILNQSDAALAQQLTAHQVPAVRRGLYPRWLTAEQNAAAIREAAIQAQQQAEQQAQADARAEQQQRQQQARAEEQARQQEAQRQQEEAARIAAARSAAEKAAAERAAALRAAQAAAVKAQASKLSGSTSNALGARKSAAVLAEEQRYYLDLLQWNLQRRTAADVKYPPWAKQFGQQGLAQLDFSLSRKGEITNIQVRDEQVADLLTGELERALTSAAKAVDLPAELNGDSWPLSVSYLFSLSGEAQPTLAMPQPPASLKSKTLGKAEQEKQLQQYRQARIDAISAKVEYPPAARILRKQGPVVVDVDVQRDGSVSAVRLSKASAHRELNDALQEAVKKAQPFPPLPEGTSVRQLTITVLYTFRL